MVISIYTRIVMFLLKEELVISCCAGFTHSYGEEKLAVLSADRPLRSRQSRRQTRVDHHAWTSEGVLSGVPGLP